MKHVCHRLILGINGFIELENIYYQVSILFEGIDLMQAIAVAYGDRSKHLTVDPVQYKQPASVLRFPVQGVQDRASFFQQTLDVEKVRTQIENRIVLSDAKVMHRAQVGKRDSLPVSQALA